MPPTLITLRIAALRSVAAPGIFIAAIAQGCREWSETPVGGLREVPQKLKQFADIV